MSKLLIPITEDEFINNVKIKFNNIIQGFDSFSNFSLNPELNNNAEESIIKLIEEIFIYNKSTCYIDFYINRLSEEERKNLLNLVPKEDREALTEIIAEENKETYYKVDNREVLPFLTRLSTRENFFITFYFTNPALTIWGNYGMKFPLFCDSEESLRFYKKLCEKYNLI